MKYLTLNRDEINRAEYLKAIQWLRKKDIISDKISVEFLSGYSALGILYGALIGTNKSVIFFNDTLTPKQRNVIPFDSIVSCSIEFSDSPKFVKLHMNSGGDYTIGVAPNLKIKSHDLIVFKRYLDAKLSGQGATWTSGDLPSNPEPDKPNKNKLP